jgi:hypothetical protein
VTPKIVLALVGPADPIVELGLVGDLAAPLMSAVGLHSTDSARFILGHMKYQCLPPTPGDEDDPLLDPPQLKTKPALALAGHIGSDGASGDVDPNSSSTTRCLSGPSSGPAE